MNNKIIFCITNCILISCNAPKNSITNTTIQRDTFHIEQLTPINIPPDSTTINALLKCDSLGRVYISQINILNQHNKTLSFQLDSIGNLNQKIIHHHDTIWIPKTKIKIIEKNNVKSENHQIKYKTPPFIKNIITIESLIIVIILIIYIIKKHLKKIKTKLFIQKQTKTTKTNNTPSNRL